MTIFNANYIDVFTGNKRTETITIDDMCYESDKEVFILAMAIAYDHLDKINECFDNLEFIAN